MGTATWTWWWGLNRDARWCCGTPVRGRLRASRPRKPRRRSGRPTPRLPSVTSTATGTSISSWEAPQAACSTFTRNSEGVIPSEARGLPTRNRPTLDHLTPRLPQQFPQHRTVAYRLVLAVAPHREIRLRGERREHRQHPRGGWLPHFRAVALHEPGPARRRDRLAEDPGD